MSRDGDEPTERQGPAQPGPHDARASQSARSWKSDVLRHPLLVALIGFVLTGLLGNFLTARFSDQTHEKDIELSTRSTALAAVSDISDLTNERRERATLVVSAINRGATAAETDSRKSAYDEAYVRWNARVPGDLLRIRSALRFAYRPPYERYIDALTDIDAISSAPPDRAAGQPASHRPGLLTLMDNCLTKSYDVYRSSGYDASSVAARSIIKSCRFTELYSRSVFCFSTIAELLYSSVEPGKNINTDLFTKEEVREACTPPVAGKQLDSHDIPSSKT